MNYKLLGNSGLRVSEICLGTMTFGKEWGWGCDKAESRKIYQYYREAGGNFIDTANLYTEGTSEKFVGEFISGERDKVVLATKYTLRQNKESIGEPNLAGNHRKNLVQSVEASLKRLNTNYIDLLWVHAWDGFTPVGEMMRALDDLVRSGKILYIGISDAPAWVVAQANTLAQLRGWTEFIALQIEYSLIERTPERELLPMAKAFNVTVTPWAALGGGVLTGKYLSKDNDAKRLKEDSERLGKKNTEIAKAVVKTAGDIGCTPAQLAIRWTMQREQAIIPIIGARKVSQLKDSLGCLNINIPEGQLEALEKVSKIDLGFPHEFYNRESVYEILHAGTGHLIDP